jgi:hypothetical protein
MGVDLWVRDKKRQREQLSPSAVKTTNLRTTNYLEILFYVRCHLFRITAQQK